MLIITIFAAIIFSVSYCDTGVVFAAQDNGYYNSSTGNGNNILIYDEADLLTDGEESELLTYMEPVSRYGNAVFLSTTSNTDTPNSFARRFYRNNFGQEDGCVFLIDMSNREIYIYNENGFSRIITSAYSYTITDNVYRYASDGDYFTCSVEAFRQISSLLEGNRIAQPMKYICNLLLAVMIGILINYLILRAMAKTPKPSERELLSGINAKCSLKNANKVFVHESRRYSPINTSSGSSSGGGSSGGSSGGRSSGGGHKF